MARRYPEITTVSIHPGIILTELYGSARESIPLATYAMGLVRPFTVGERQGAWNALWAAAGVEKKGLCNGDYYSPVGIKAWDNPFVCDGERGRVFWEWTEEQICKAGS